MVLGSVQAVYDLAEERLRHLLAVGLADVDGVVVHSLGRCPTRCIG